MVTCVLCGQNQVCLFRSICLPGFLNAVRFAVNLAINLPFKNKNNSGGNKNHSWHMLSHGCTPCAKHSTHLVDSVVTG